MASHLILLLLFTLSAASAFADVFVSIDCGSSGVSTDGNSIVWTGDDNVYTVSGESHEVQLANSLSPVMDTLRVFSTRKKNCYSVDAEKNGQILVRASFYYGNYDGKDSPPTFDLQFDGNHWATVLTSTTKVVSYEAIYVVKGDSISVCVAQTFANQLPFISALEVRSLGSNMYKHVDSEYALFLTRRAAFGSNESVRYIDDPYDRIWDSASNFVSLSTVQNEAPVIDTNIEDDPPQAVLQHAVTTPDTTWSILIGTRLPDTEVPVYINMYFSEVTELNSTQKRSFELYQNNVLISNPIIPPYGSVTELYLTNITASSNTNFTLMATTGSTETPLINACEVFVVSDVLTQGTNSVDVEGLGLLQSTFEVLQDWRGDPCLPASFTWDWVNCSAEATPRVTALFLSGFSLSSPLPDFSSMDAIRTIDLHNNSLDGPIPDFLATLPNLRELNLADNDFSGPIPTSLSGNSKLKLVVSGNPNLCASGESCNTVISFDPSSNDTKKKSTSTPKKKKKGNKKSVILGTTIPISVIFSIIMGVIAKVLHKRKTAAAKISTEQGRPANTPQGNQFNVQMASKIGEAVINKFNGGTNREEQNKVNGDTHCEEQNNSDEHEEQC